jgi:GNAT superfamily N-acetyltransferase/predicted nucleic acid-binding protein
MVQSSTTAKQKSIVFIIKKRPHEVAPFVSLAQKHADAEKRALGFIPKSAYEDAAVQGKLWVAVSSLDGAEEYVGHILWGGAFPRLRIFQMFVAKSYRRKGVASILIEDLEKEAESLSYLTISARVAEDLDANSFWERRGFGITRSVPGGATTKRFIHYRERRLNTPTLFDLLRAVTPPTDNDLRLAERLYSKAPVYTLDVNVLLDVAQNRPRADSARKIVSAAMQNVIRLYVAEELVTELKRSASAHKDDPALEFASSLPCFPALPKTEETRLQLELTQIVFPEKARQNRLRDRDKSDILHLATAIHNRVAGFLTSEQGILKRGALLREKYGLDVVGVTEFAESLDTLPWREHQHVLAVAAAHTEISSTELDETNRGDAERFLKSLRVESDVMTEAIAPGPSRASRRRLVISDNEGIAAYASWDAPQAAVPYVDAFIFLRDANLAADYAVDYVFFLVTSDACRKGLVLIRIVSKLPTIIEERATTMGFRPASPGDNSRGTLQKVSLGKIVHSENWKTVREELVRKLKIGLPEFPPSYAVAEKGMVVTNPRGVAVSIPLAKLEALVGPVLITLADRPAAIVPIEPHFAEELLGTSDQFGLFAKYEAAVLHTRTYYSGIGALSVLRPGTILLFYESKGKGRSGAIVACARSVANQVETVSEMKKSTKRGGVLEDKAIERISRGKKKGVTIFDTVMKFAKPIPYGKLKDNGYITAANLVTSQKITCSQLLALLEEGRPYV